MNQPQPIVIMDSSHILEGKLEELKTAIKELVEFVEANEPRTIAYNVYFSEDGTRMTVVQVHADSASMEYHMKTAGPAFPKFRELIRLSTMDIYGKPSDSLLEQMRQKARMLGNATVVVHEHQAGFTRFVGGKGTF
jgi:quinol monooxygenase YgiN